MRVALVAVLALAHVAVLASWAPIASNSEASLHLMGTRLVLILPRGDALVIDAMDDGPLSLCDDAVRTVGWSNAIVFPLILIGGFASMVQSATTPSIVRTALWIIAGVAIARTVAVWILTTKSDCTVAVFGQTADWVVGPGTLLGLGIDLGIVLVAAYPLFPDRARVYAALRRRSGKPAYAPVAQK